MTVLVLWNHRYYEIYSSISQHDTRVGSGLLQGTYRQSHSDVSRPTDPPPAADSVPPSQTSSPPAAVGRGTDLSRAGDMKNVLSVWLKPSAMARCLRATC